MFMYSRFQETGQVAMFESAGYETKQKRSTVNLQKLI